MPLVQSNSIPSYATPAPKMSSSNYGPSPVSAALSNKATPVNNQKINQIFSSIPKSSAIPANKPGIVPQVYSGSTGSGSNQNASTNKYGGYTPGAATAPSFTFGGGSSSGGSSNKGSQTASVYTSVFGNSGGSSSNEGASGGWEPYSMSTNAYGPTLPASYSDSSRLNKGSTANVSKLYTEPTKLPYGPNPNNAQATPTATPMVDPYKAQYDDQRSQYDNQYSNQDGLYAKAMADIKARANQNQGNVDQANQEMADFAGANASQIARIQGDNNLSSDTQQGKSQVANDQFSRMMPAYQNKLQTAIGQRTADNSSMEALMAANAPHWNGYVGMNPMTGQALAGQGGINNAIQQGVGYGAQQSQGEAYQAGLKNLRTADSMQGAIEATLSQNPQLNNTPISAINNIRQWFAGQSSDPKQQILAQQVSGYVQALGYSPDQAAQIASQRGGTIGQLLNNLRNQYEAQNNANYGSGSSQTNSGGNTYNGYKLPY